MSEQQPQKPATHAAVPIPVLNGIIAYLKRQPYEDVEPALSAMTGLQLLTIEPASGANDDEQEMEDGAPTV